MEPSFEQEPAEKQHQATRAAVSENASEIVLIPFQELTFFFTSRF